MADDNEQTDDADAEVNEAASRGSADRTPGNLGEWPHDDEDNGSKHASAERIAAAAGGSDAAGGSAGDAADVPVPSEDAAAGTSETFPPITS